MEFIRDAEELCGWKRQTYDNGRVSKGIGSLPGEMMEDGAGADADADAEDEG